MEEQSPTQTTAKWEGEVSAVTATAKPQEIWPLLADDFCSLHKWLPIDTCRHVEGESGQPGLTRYCATTDTSSPSPSIKWVHERLILIDATQHILTYEIRENNIGFKSYVATFKLLPGGDGDDGGGCKVLWSFVADPIEGWPLEEFVKYLDISLKHMVNKMADFLQRSP